MKFGNLPNFDNHDAALRSIFLFLYWSKGKGEQRAVTWARAWVWAWVQAQQGRVPARKGVGMGVADKQGGRRAVKSKEARVAAWVRGQRCGQEAATRARAW